MPGLRLLKIFEAADLAALCGVFQIDADRVMLALYDRKREAVLRGLSLVFAVAAFAGLVAEGRAADGHKALRLAQSSTTTNCMMTCNSQAATCQSTCVVPSTPPTSAATTTSNATAGQSCLSNCSSQQLSCQTNCARISPSQ